MAEYYEDEEYRRQELDRHRENAARTAMAYADFETTGQGSVEFARRVDFGLTFIEMPYVSYGSILDVDAWENDLEAAYGVDFSEGTQSSVPLPIVSGFVTQWDRDDRDFYIGCWCAVRVYIPQDEWEIGPDLNPTIEHHFTFVATAMKDIPLGPPGSSEGTEP